MAISVDQQCSAMQFLFSISGRRSLLLIYVLKPFHSKSCKVQFRVMAEVTYVVLKKSVVFQLMSFNLQNGRTQAKETQLI